MRMSRADRVRGVMTTRMTAAYASPALGRGARSGDSLEVCFEIDNERRPRRHLTNHCSWKVYRARDTRLDRDVAIKVLPDAVASDPERIARFEREAKTLAALNHPNIAHMYGLESQPRLAGQPAVTSYIVMELVEGSTLAPPNSALSISAAPLKSPTAGMV
jgi:hypothetical protein